MKIEKSGTYCLLAVVIALLKAVRGGLVLNI
jgi:hypothetical protein